MLAIENGTVYTPDRVIPDGVVLVEGRRIDGVGKRGELAIPPDARRLDAGGGIVAPGFVNMHVHGVGGHGTNDGEVAALQEMSRLLAAHGVTAWTPTVGSWDPANGPGPMAVACKALAAIAEAQAAEQAGAEILGCHMEAPYRAEAERGAMPAHWAQVPNPREYGLLLEHAGVMKVFTLAPELPGAVDLTRELVKRGVLVSVGHSIAIDEELERAVDAGLSHATHMFCNMGTLRRVNLRRVAGLVESVLLDDRLTAEIITDGYHIAPSLMKLALKVKGPEKVAIITDGSELTGMPAGRYGNRGRDIIKEENIAFVADRSAYAGSVATMDQCLRCAVEGMELSLADALRMAGLTPAAILGLADRKGSLEAGKDADIVVLDHGLRVVNTVVAGAVVYPGPGPSAPVGS